MLAINITYYNPRTNRSTRPFPDGWTFVRADTQTVIGRFDVPGVQATWKPDGTELAISENTEQEARFYFLDTQTWKVIRKITFPFENSVMPYQTPTMWSPDGTKIAFGFAQDNVSGNWRLAIYIADLATERATLIASDPGFSLSHPAWSPDGSAIAMRATPVKKLYGDGYLAFVDVKTGCLQVYSEILVGQTFSWLPDGKQIAYRAYDGLYTVDVDTIPDRYHVPGKMCGAAGTPTP
jgi:Tol biopolymer transport system component